MGALGRDDAGRTTPPPGSTCWSSPRPTTQSAGWPPSVVPVADHRGRPPLGLARPRRARRPPAPGLAPPPRARCPTAAIGARAAALGDHLRRGRRPDHRGRGRRRSGGRAVEVDDARPGRLPRRGLDRRQPPGGPASARSSGWPPPAGLPLDAFAGLMRAATDDALALGPRPGPDRARRPGRLGHASSATARRSPRWPATAPSWPPTTPWSAWPGGSPSIRGSDPAARARRPGGGRGGERVA